MAKSVGLRIERILGGGLEEGGSSMIVMVELEGAAVPVRLSLPRELAPDLIAAAAGALAGTPIGAPADRGLLPPLQPRAVRVGDAAGGVEVALEMHEGTALNFMLTGTQARKMADDLVRTGKAAAPAMPSR
jgi:hypothetical protein